MSAAAMSYPPLRPVLPFPRPATAGAEQTGLRRAAALGLSAHPPTPELARLLLIDDDPAGLADQLRRAFPTPAHRVRVAGVEDGREGVDRTGSDVAEHHAERADHNGQANSFSAAGRARR